MSQSDVHLGLHWTSHRFKASSSTVIEFVHAFTNRVPFSTNSSLWWRIDSWNSWVVLLPSTRVSLPLLKRRCNMTMALFDPPFTLLKISILYSCGRLFISTFGIKSKMGDICWRMWEIVDVWAPLRGHEFSTTMYEGESWETTTTSGNEGTLINMTRETLLSSSQDHDLSRKRYSQKRRKLSCMHPRRMLLTSWSRLWSS